MEASRQISGCSWAKAQSRLCFFLLLLKSSREYILFFFLFFFRYEYILLPPSPARREGSRSSRDGCPAPRGCDRAGRQPGVPPVPGHACAGEGEHNPAGLSHLPAGLAPTHAGAWTTACCCCCYFLSVFLDINTSSLHPQDGFQASILFPMATKTQPANLNPLTRVSGKQGRWGEPRPLRAGHFTLTQNYFKAKLLALPQSKFCYACGSSGSKAVQSPGASPDPGEQGDTGRRKGLAATPLHLHPSPARAGPAWVPGQSTGPRCSPARSHPAPAAGTPGMLHDARASPKIPNSSGKGHSKEWLSKRNGGGRITEQPNHINSNPNRPRE